MTRSEPASTLPPLTPEEAAHSARAQARIRERIYAAGGSIDFETFMELALYAPGLGYYSAGSTKLGAAGDFVTAPELSPLFGRCLARQCAQILGALGEESEILEFGAGSGRLAAVVLESLAALGRAPRRYQILEVSADLRERQRERLGRLPAALAERVVWLERLPRSAIRGVILANEVLDALPCRRFVIHAAGPRELGVGLADDGQLVEVEREPDARLAAALAQLLAALSAPLPLGYRSELCLRVAPWITSAAESLAEGVMLLTDYGLPRAQYYHPERGTGTLRAHFRHRAHEEPLARAAVQDITAWVDFTRVAEAAVAAQLDVVGFATQAGFLLGTGIEALVAEAGELSERVRRAGEARRLLLPGEMGEAFKALALARAWQSPLAGFAVQDLRASL
ncbi:MAG TPA: SAM-dependent methyltransferase [Steroidobacteraceae bacterium]|nr:SAM-dependent methyltransferase [Steroidobacteraceae bacterium]